MKSVIKALTLCTVILLSAIPKASAAVTRTYANITVTKVTVRNLVGSPGSLLVDANIDICPSANKTTALIYNDTTNSADFKNTSAWFMAAYLAGKKMDIQVTVLDAQPDLCRIEYIWVY